MGRVRKDYYRKWVNGLEIKVEIERDKDNTLPTSGQVARRRRKAKRQ